MTKYLGTKQDPLSSDGVCTNSAIADRFTCPGCYDEMPGETGVQICSCGAIVHCANVVPDYVDSVATMITVEDAYQYQDELEALGIEVPA